MPPLYRGPGNGLPAPIASCLDCTRIREVFQVSLHCALEERRFGLVGATSLASQRGIKLGGKLEIHDLPKDGVTERAILFTSEGDPMMQRSHLLLASHESNPAFRRRGWRHQLPYRVEHDLELTVVFGFQIVEPLCQIPAVPDKVA